MLKLIYLYVTLIVASTTLSAQTPFNIEDTKWKGSHNYAIYEGTSSELRKSDPIKVEFVKEAGLLMAIVTRSNSAGDPYMGTTSKFYCDVKQEGDDTFFLEHKDWIKRDPNSFKKKVNIRLTVQADPNVLKGELISSTGSNHSMTFTLTKVNQRKKRKKKRG